MTDFTQPANPKAALKEHRSAKSRSSTSAGGDLFAFPLSPAQEKMWQADRALPGNPSYNASFRWKLEGPLDTQILERSFNEIVRRHEILRATFSRNGGTPVQLIAPSAHLRIDVRDLRPLAPEKRESEMDRLSAEEARRSVDIEKGPLIRVGLLRMEDQHHILMLTIHHLVCDGWSIGLIMEELQKIYAAFAEGHDSPLPELGIQYPDYVVWQRERIASAEVERQLGYWKEKFANYKRFEVLADFPRAAQRTTNSAIASMLLPRELTETLKEFSNKQGGTLFITSLAVCLALLRRYSGETDIAVGSPLAGRNRADLESLVGLFVNHVVFRSDVSGDPSFPEFAAKVRDTVWEAFANQDVPFENVVKAVRSGQESQNEPFYFVNFICQREYARAATFVFEFAGIRMSTMPSKSQGALYDLNFFMVEREVGWRLSLEYNTDIYSEGTAQQMLAHFRELLDGVAAKPDRRLSEFPLSGNAQLPRKEQPIVAPPSGSAVLAETKTGPSLGPAAVEIFAMPASPPQKRFWLLEKLAPGNRAFYMPACVRLNGSISQPILEKAFQVLIDRHETLRTTFEEMKNELMQVITSSREFSLRSSSLEDIPQAQRELQLTELIRQEAGEPFDLSRGPLLRARLFRLDAREHVLVVTIHHILADGWSQSIIQRDLWTAYEALAHGQEPSLPPLAIQYSDFTAWQKDWLLSPESQKHMEFWTKQLTPPLPVLDFPADRPPQNRPASHGAMETLLLPQELTSALKSLGQSQEVTMFTLMLACFGVLLSRYTNEEDVLIGSPVANRRPETEPLIGPFAGPVCLRLNLAGNPTLREMLSRVREVTLDAMTYAELPFEVLVDKIKVRSVHGRNPLFQFYFIYQTAFLQTRELGDLTISPMPTFSLGTPFELQLALIERSEGVRAQLEYNPDLFDSSTIRAVLDYYVEILRSFVSSIEKRVAHIPPPARTTSSVHVLPAAGSHSQFVAPHDSTELQLLLIWERLLERLEIGVRDNFFDLGGQSLLAAHLVSEVEKAFGRKIDLSTLLTAPTIEQMARHLRSKEATEHSSLVPIRPSGSKPPLFCVHGGGGHVLRFRAMAARLDPDQPFYGLRSPEVDGAVKKVTVEELAAGYIRDIRSLQSHGPYNLSGASFGGLVAYEMATQLVAQGEQVGVVALFDTGNPAYYRDLSFSQSMRFRASYLLERIERYGKRLLHGETWQLVRDLGHSFYIRASGFAWNVFQKLYSVRQRPMPGALRDNVMMFSSVAQAYSPKPYPGRVTLFRAAGRTAEYGSDPALGWEEVVRGEIKIITVPGDHMTILEEPHVWNLVEQLSACLEEIRTTAPPKAR
jgi:non-ribosomal peptide synthetase component F/thioesterase domain-containing protein/acyl carrier protein